MKRNFAKKQKLVKIFLRNAKMQKKFHEMWKLCKNHELYSCNNYLLRRTCGILCSDSSIFKVLICHKNNFSSITWINVWWREFDSTSYLFKFLSVRTRNFREMFALFISRNIQIIFSRKFFIFFAKQIKAKFSRADFSFTLETIVLILIVCEIQIIKFIL